MSERHYVVRPRAERDLDDQSYYYGSVGSSKLGHRFLVAVHETFALLATQPDMGWRSRFSHPDLKHLRVFRVKDFEKILVLYLPLFDGVEILRVIHGSRNIETLLRRGDVDIAASDSD